VVAVTSYFTKCFAWAAVCSLLFIGSPTIAQYMYVDTDGDGVSTSNDRLNVPGTTRIDVWLHTDRNRDGTTALCASGQALTINSYTVDLEAVGGTVTWGSWLNNQPFMGTELGTSSTPTSHRAGQLGSTALSPGLYMLGSVDVFVTLGRPEIRIAVQDSIGGYPTLFGSTCVGGDNNNSMALGADWLDADGAAAADSYVVFSETFELNQGTLPSYWFTSGYPLWTVNSFCGYKEGNYSVSGAGSWCNSYPSSSNNVLTFATPQNVSQLREYRVSFRERHALATDADPALNDYFSYGFHGGPTAGSITSLTGNVHLTGTRDVWTRVRSPLHFNIDHTLNFMKPTFALVGTHSPPFGTSGVWIDAIQVFGTDWPDLAISSSITASGNSSSDIGTLTAGQPWNLRFSVKNYGRTNMNFGTSCRIEVFLDDSPSYLEFMTISALELNSGVEKDIVWALPGLSGSGTHRIKLRIDTDNDVYESDGTQHPELNNTRPFPGGTLQFTWQAPPQPNLRIGGIPSFTEDASSGSPALAPSIGTRAETFITRVGRNITIYVPITNDGNAASGAFQLGFYKNPSTVPSYAGPTPDDSFTVASIAPHDTRTVAIHTTSNQAILWNFYVLADFRDVVAESDNGNNGYGPQQIQWVANAITVKGRFVYQDSTWGIQRTNGCIDIFLYDWDSPTKADLLAWTSVTNDSGAFVFPAVVNTDDPSTDQSYLDLFVRVKYQSNESCWNSQYASNYFIHIKRPSTDSTWQYDSGGYADVTDSTLNVGVLRPMDEGNRTALHLLNTIIDQGWSPIRDNTPANEPIPGVSVWYEPGFTHPTWYSDDSIAVFVQGDNDSSSLAPDGWDNQVVLHEYMHHIVRNIAGEQPGGGHLITALLSDTAFAWSEGFASFFGAALGDKPWTPGYGKITNFGRGPGGTLTLLYWDIEKDSVRWYDPNLSTIQYSFSVRRGNPVSGPHSEAAIAGALWDLYDANDEPGSGTFFGDTVQDGFGRIWECMRSVPAPGLRSVNAFQSKYESLYARQKDDYARNAAVRRLFLDHGIYSGRDTATVSSVEGSETSANLVPRLLGSLPKPSGGEVGIRFSGGGLNGGVATISIYDMRGRLVRILREERIRPGVNVVVWNGRTSSGLRVASGVYLCQLEAGGVKDQERLVIIR
jgi:CARDB